MGILVAGVLPIEEAFFFLLTNALLVFGVVLGLSTECLFRFSPQLNKVLRISYLTKSTWMRF
jgi:hypothetical protein